MEIVMRKVSELTPYDKNAKKHDAKQIANVANSIRRFGWQQPIVIDEHDVVVIGHCRLLAAKRLRLDEVPVTVASGLTDEEIRELRIADNKTNESPWDEDILRVDLDGLDFEGFDLDFPLLAQEDEDGAADIEESALSPYQHVHYLVTVDVNDNDRFLPLIEQLRDMGAEVKETRNNT